MDKIYDLEDRTRAFALGCRSLIRKLKQDIGNIEDSKQLVRASGSVAANYIEANESLSDKDFVYRAKVCRKEAKESRLWLNLLSITEPDLEQQRAFLTQEATEFINIFTSMIGKFPNQDKR